MASPPSPLRPGPRAAVYFLPLSPMLYFVFIAMPIAKCRATHHLCVVEMVCLFFVGADD